MRRRVSMAQLDRPWRRPGAVRYALRRLPGLLRPAADAHEPAAGQPCSTGAVGLPGVSYLAISQWKAADVEKITVPALI